MIRSGTQFCARNRLYMQRTRSHSATLACYGLRRLSTTGDLPKNHEGFKLSGAMRDRGHHLNLNSIQKSSSPAQTIYEVQRNRKIRYNEMMKLTDDVENYEMNVRNFLNNRLQEFELRDVCDFMRLAGKKSRFSGMLRNFLPAIVIKLEELTISGQWTYLHVAFLLYGLQCLNGEDENVSRILAIVTKKADVLLNSRLTPLPQDVAMMMLGLQNNACEDVYSKTFLVVLARMIDICPTHTPLLPKEIQNLLYGMKAMTSDSAEVRDLLTALAPLLRTCVTPLSATEIANTIYGLQGMDSSVESVRAVISSMVPLAQSCNEPFSGQNVGNAVYGMQRMDSRSEEVEQLISAIVPNIAECTEKLRSQAVGNALYGLRTMTCESDAVLSLLRVLIPRVVECNEIFSSQGVSNSLFGMKGLSSETKEVQYLLRAFLPKVYRCTENFNAQAVGNSLYGMRRMRTDDAIEVRELLSLLIEKVKLCTEDLNPQEIGNALYGIQGMSDEIPETSQMLDLIGQMVVKCRKPFPSRSICSSLFGFNRMGSTTPSVRHILWALHPKVVGCKEQFNKQEISNAVYGMRSMCNSSEEVRDIIFALIPKLAGCTGGLSVQQIILIVHGLRRMDCTDPVLRKMISTFTVHVKASPHKYSDYEKSVIEKCINTMGLDVEEVIELNDAFDGADYEVRDEALIYALLDDPSYDETLRTENDYKKTTPTISAVQPKRMPPKLTDKLQKLLTHEQ